MYRLIDLFSGAGGLTLGFARSNAFQPVWAIDNDQAASETYRSNFGDHIELGDIETWLKDPRHPIPEADVVVGGPPCQGFSFLNRQRHGDARRQLWRPFLEVVKRSGAQAFLIENVQGLLTSPEMESIRETAHAHGFTVTANVINAADYGVPQVRRRCVIVGTRVGGPFEFPRPTHSRGAKVDGSLPWLDVRSAIGDLPPPKGTSLGSAAFPLDLHFGRNVTELSRSRYRAVPPGGNRFDLQRNAPELTPRCWLNKPTGSTDLFGRLVWNEPSVTIRTEFWKPEKGRYLHPKQHRSITHREAARLMGFPDEFLFKGSKIEIARQIGNAVPPPVAAALAVRLAEHLKAPESAADFNVRDAA